MRKNDAALTALAEKLDELEATCNREARQADMEAQGMAWMYRAEAAREAAATLRSLASQATPATEGQEIIHLSPEAQAQLLAALDNPPEPSEALRRAIQRHRAGQGHAATPAEERKPKKNECVCGHFDVYHSSWGNCMVEHCECRGYVDGPAAWELNEHPRKPAPPPALYREALAEQATICYRCQMELPMRLTRSAIGPRGGVDNVCAACSPEPGPDGEAKRAEVVAMRRARWSLAAPVTPARDGQTQIGTTAKCGCLIDHYGELSVSPHCTKHQTASRAGE